LALSRALALVRRGRVREAADACRALLATLEHGHQLLRPLAAALLAVSLQESDAPAEAMRAVDAGLEAADESELGRLWLEHARATICLERGELADALDAVNESEHLARALGIANPAVVPWQLVGAHCYAQAGNRSRAAELMERGSEAAEAFGTPETICLSLRARAALAQPASALAHLERAAELVRGSGAELEQAKALVAYGAALQGLGQDRRARTILKRGIDISERLGAARVSRLGIRALVAAGGRPRRRRITGPDALTPAERRVVALARTGARNRDIADELVIAQKTVEWHLSKAYAKLGVSSREDLRQAPADPGR
ncbi:MAG: helix-turn-helix transcriptional regulator, partial [Solirubrobacteraceae bacterium]